MKLLKFLKATDSKAVLIKYGIAFSIILLLSTFLPASLTAIIIKLVVIIAGVFIFTIQAREVLRPVDGLTVLRWQILAAVGISVLAGIPSLIYQFVRLSGDESSVLRELATVTSNVSQLAVMALLLMIFTYVKRDK